MSPQSMKPKKFTFYRYSRPAPLIITHYPAWSWPGLLVILLFVVGTGLGISGWLFSGHDQCQSQLLEKEQALALMLEQNSQLMIQNQNLKKELVKAMQQATVATQVTSEETEMRQALQKRQDENLELKKRLTFYENLLAFSEAPELQVILKSFTLNRGEGEHDYTYQLALTQLARMVKIQSGQITIDITGIQNGEKKRLTMQELTENSVEFLKYSFRYFQNFEGRLALPKQFVPHQVIVSILPKGRKEAKEVRFAWQDLQ